jgi:PAS domain S-box-containing protein
MNTLEGKHFDSFRQHMLEHLPLAAYICDAEGLITYYNPAAIAMWGRAPRLKDPKDRYCGSLKLYTKDGELVPHDQSWMARALKEGREYEHRELVIERPDSSRTLTLVHATPIHNEQGEVIGAVNIIMDANDHKHAQRMTEAHEAREDIASHVKSEFVAQVSHDLRTPINAIVGLSNLLELSISNPMKLKEYIGTLKLTTQQLLDTINNMLDISRLESNQVQLENIAFKPTEIVEEIVGIHTVRSEEKDMEIRVENSCNTNLSLMGDPLRFRQVVMNLVSNAVKFTKRGAVTISLSCDHNSAPDRAHLQLKVSDTGIGIPTSQQGMIFNKFTHGDTSVTRKYGGTGLGLAITKSLVELMKGDITVSSVEGKGSTFSVHIPFLVAGANKPTASSQPPQTMRSTEPKWAKNTMETRDENQKKRILLVEDYPANILVATSILSTLGYDYDVAQNGKTAIEKIAEGNFDAVLMDVQMPEMDGLMATKLVRERERSESASPIPIIGMTAHALRGDRERCIEAGMTDYIAKPFQPEELVAKLNQYTMAQQRQAG